MGEGFKSVITNWSKKVETTIDAGDINSISSVRDSLKECLQKIHELDNEILNLTDPGEQPDQIMNQAEYSLKVGTEIHRLNSSIMSLLAVRGEPSALILPVKATVKLPKLDLKYFDGDLTEWNSFWELYEVSVHQRSDFENIQKFSYLKGLLEGEALELISDFKLEGDKYLQAVNLLKETYGRKDEIKLCLVRKLFQTETPKADAESLQGYRAQFECCIRSLESEKLEVSELYTILLYTKLPGSVSEIIKRCGENWQKLDTFKKYLEEEVHNLRAFPQTETAKANTLTKVSAFAVEQGQSVRPKTTSVRPKESTNKAKVNQVKGCALCRSNHIWTHCKSYVTRGGKIERFRALGLCFICVSSKHFSSDCDRQGCITVGLLGIIVLHAIETSQINQRQVGYKLELSL
ncbi:uncharacterized protein [Macrobrachium rosenbergii]|uniref:uncharacterized protein n=1 Tax=Macrobrachium rosenbergii TaxID=79674 RepID=UPI0034D47472